MDVNTILNNESILEVLLTKHLHTVWQDNDTDDFILKCVDLIYNSPPQRNAIVKSIVKRSYPYHWIRIEKLLVLK